MFVLRFDSVTVDGLVKREMTGENKGRAFNSPCLYIGLAERRVPSQGAVGEKLKSNSFFFFFLVHISLKLRSITSPSSSRKEEKKKKGLYIKPSGSISKKAPDAGLAHTKENERTTKRDDG